MSYLADVSRVVIANEQELRADLHQAQRALQRSKLESAELERQVEVIEALLELAAAPVATPAGDGMTLHKAMALVIGESPQQMLRAADLAAEINRRRLYRMRDGRPVEAQQIHARVGHYPDVFQREGTFIKLAD